ncbi:MAG TPA: helix-turn-helix domain-containing protein [Candidatus Limnocylindria bacterium]|jgi:transcriptional regulator with XRE-family HTH domain|nr:helix-turn-helix domain-containing protein [Candidatus Limnocylindria bacterium]
MDELHLGRTIRALRRRRGWRQLDLAEAAGVHQSDVSRLARGYIGAYRVDAVRRVLVALEATLYRPRGTAA